MKYFIHLLFVFILAISCQSQQIGNLTAFEDENGLYGYKNAKGEVVIPAQYLVVFDEEFTNKIAFVASEKDIVAIDKQGNYVLTPFIFDNGPDYPSEGVFRIVENKKMGFADLNGNIIIPPTFDFVRPFADGRAAFNKGGQMQQDGEYQMLKGGTWGFIDKKGKIVIPPIYTDVSDFENKKATVTTEEQKNISIDKAGNLIQEK